MSKIGCGYVLIPKKRLPINVKIYLFAQKRRLRSFKRFSRWWMRDSNNVLDFFEGELQCNNKSSDGSSDGKRGNSFLRQKSSEGDGKKCTQEHGRPPWGGRRRFRGAFTKYVDHLPTNHLLTFVTYSCHFVWNFRMYFIFGWYHDNLLMKIQ